MIRNIKKVQEIEEARKQGRNPIRMNRSPTPRKIIKKIDYCEKFKKNPGKFYSEPLCELEIRSLELILNDNLFRSTDFNSKLNSSTNPFETDSVDCLNRISESVELINTPEENTKLKEIISNINI